jgi:nucleoside-diphosphate-sugar epimerase
MPERLGEATSTLADISKIQKYLEYEPSMGLEDWINSQK